ncbi:putative mitochondrial protein [Cardamine amara subsp. amara]|uniref:Mitochondrial protein n=1 Tax=Cardamine amara subsp. amara TaxID=228776 RepID=A0ABD1BHF7_CARAN
MCDVSNFAVRAVLGQKKDKKLHAIYYASRTLDEAQKNYATTEKELLAVVFAFEKFRPYLVGSKGQEGVENGAADHLSRIKVDDNVPINDFLPEENVYLVELDRPWYADIANYLAADDKPLKLTGYAKKRFLREVRRFHWDELYLYKYCSDGMYRRCIAETEVPDVLFHCHGSDYAGHFATFKTVSKVLQARFWWPTMFRDANEFVARCDSCQRKGKISKRYEMPHRISS